VPALACGQAFDSVSDFPSNHCTDENLVSKGNGCQACIEFWVFSH
jgi:murein endopeptidase